MLLSIWRSLRLYPGAFTHSKLTGLVSTLFTSPGEFGWLLNQPRIRFHISQMAL